MQVRTKVDNVEMTSEEEMNKMFEKEQAASNEDVTGHEDYIGPLFETIKMSTTTYKKTFGLEEVF